MFAMKKRIQEQKEIMGVKLGVKSVYMPLEGDIVNEVTHKEQNILEEGRTKDGTLVINSRLSDLQS